MSKSLVLALCGSAGLSPATLLNEELREAAGGVVVKLDVWARMTRAEAICIWARAAPVFEQVFVFRLGRRWLCILWKCLSICEGFCYREN